MSLTRRLLIPAALTTILVVSGLSVAAAQDPVTLSDGTGAKIGFSQWNAADVWRTNQTNQVQEFCSQLMPNAEINVTDGAGDPLDQDADVTDLITQEIDVLLLTPGLSAELTPAAQRAVDANIPVITLDRAVEIPVTLHIGADNKLIGQQAAKFVAETLLGGQGGNVLEIQGTIGASATTDRHDEFVAWLADNAPNVTILDSQTGNYRREDALTVMDDYLQRFGPGEAQVVYTHNDEEALGALQSLEQAGRADEMQVVGIDGQNEAIQAIADGKIAATFTYDNAGQQACQAAQLLLSGVPILDPHWVLPTNQIDSTNAADWVGKGF
jgi:ribose transport system substrate-binding protein